MKLNEIANSHTEIEAILKDYKIKNFAIHPDGTVDVDGEVDLRTHDFTKLPVKFGVVTGNFDCSNCCNLTSLEGSPSSVGGDFYCHRCRNLTSLGGAPMKVGGNFTCYDCSNLTSLEGFVTRIGAYMNCGAMTHIKSGGISLVLSGVEHIIIRGGAFEIIEKYLGRPEDIFECQAELINAGYEEYAQL